MKRTVKQVADFVHARLVGDGAVEVTGIASIQYAKSGDLTFVEDERNFALALRSRAAAVVTGEFARGNTKAKPLLLADQPKLAFARAAQLLYPKRARDAGIHPSAAVHPSAKLGAGVAIDERVVIGEDVNVGDATWIAAGCVIGSGSRIGKHCELFPNVSVYPGVNVGNRVIVNAGAVLGSDGFGYVRDATSGAYEKFPQIGRLEIADDVEIGANSTIDRGALDVTRIGRGTKIDNLVHIAHNCQIGENVVIAAQTGLSGSAVVEDNVVIGGQVGIADHVVIKEGAILGAQSGIPSNKIIRGEGVVFWGTPARPIRQYLKELAVLAKLAKR